MTIHTPSYCPYCGKKLEMIDERAGTCPSCDELVIKQPVVAAHVLLVKDDEVLMVYRKAGRRQETWGYPGGHPELDEHPKSTAKRELEEETGLSVQSDDLSMHEIVQETNADGSVYLDVAYVGEYHHATGELQPEHSEVSRVEFVPVQELSSLSLFRESDHDRAEAVIEQK